MLDEEAFGSNINYLTHPSISSGHSPDLRNATAAILNGFQSGNDLTSDPVVCTSAKKNCSQACAKPPFFKNHGSICKDISTLSKATVVIGPALIHALIIS